MNRTGIKTHGLSHTRIYGCWADMKQRCLNPKNKWYPQYGGRGITVCDEWLDFVAFYNWAISNGYAENLTLDRIDNNKGYNPDNCRWATQQEQSLNKRHLPNQTGYVGVHKRVTKYNTYYSAELCRNRRFIYVGLYRTPEAAHEAREEYIRRNNL